MHKPSTTALQGRARTLLEAMTARERWIYALPPVEAARHLEHAFTGHGFRASETEPEAKVVRWTNQEDTASFVVLQRDDLEVTLVEAQGGDAAHPLAVLLHDAGFYAQSALLASAFEVATEDARKALLTLSHMVVAWDDDWADLFLLHLASPDAVVRKDAVTALTVAAMVARDQGPCLSLLGEAEKRESYPKLQETIAEAIRIIAAIAP